MPRSVTRFGVMTDKISHTGQVARWCFTSTSMHFLLPLSSLTLFASLLSDSVVLDPCPLCSIQASAPFYTILHEFSHLSPLLLHNHASSLGCLMFLLPCVKDLEQLCVAQSILQATWAKLKLIRTNNQSNSNSSWCPLFMLNP